MSEDVSRRRFVGLLGASAGLAMAGCSSAPGSESVEPPPGSRDDGPIFDGEFETPANQKTPVDGSRYAAVYRSVQHSVVQIQVQTSAGETAQGTGWVYDDDGHIVTNEHVVRDSQGVFVRFRSTGWRSAEVVAADVYSDLAVLGVESLPTQSAPLPLGSEDPAVGTEVLAIGNPFGLSGSVSSGIVSGVNRTLPAQNNFSIPDAIQTDAPVNPGNSGGPLVDLQGTVLGVINSGGGDNIGFAISAPLVARVVPSLLATGEYDHPYMGIFLASVTPAIAREVDLDVASGVYVSDAKPDGPADGVLTEGDVIKRMGDQQIPTTQALSSFLALQTSPGETIPIEIVRNGRRVTVDLTVGIRPPPS